MWKINMILKEVEEQIVVQQDIVYASKFTDDDVTRIDSTHYELSTADYYPETLEIYRNGIRLKLGPDKDYTVSGTTITFNYNVGSDDLIIAYYVKK